MRKVYISPSLLGANKNDMKNEIHRVTSLGAKYIHFDVMDKEFIGHESFSFDDFSKIEKMHKVMNDVHIMVAKPFMYAQEFAKRGADIITFHYEALKNDVDRIDCINAIHKLGVKAGMSIKPKTDVNKLIPFLPLIDLALIMSVEPGLGGQSFIPAALDKIKKCREEIDAKQLKCLIEVDGGINDITGRDCYLAGADLLVVGSYLFGHDDLKDRYQKIIKACHD